MLSLSDTAQAKPILRFRQQMIRLVLYGIIFMVLCSAPSYSPPALYVSLWIQLIVLPTLALKMVVFRFSTSMDQLPLQTLYMLLNSNRHRFSLRPRIVGIFLQTHRQLLPCASKSAMTAPPLSQAMRMARSRHGTSPRANAISKSPILFCQSQTS